MRDGGQSNGEFHSIMRAFAVGIYNSGLVVDQCLGDHDAKTETAITFADVAL
jgi:hypothetical protein